MSTHLLRRRDRAARRRRAPRQIAPALAALVQRLGEPADSVTVQLTVAAADAIARLDARQCRSLRGHDNHPARHAVAQPAAIDRATALQWHALAWQAVRAGVLSRADAQTLTDQIEPPDAA